MAKPVKKRKPNEPKPAALHMWPTTKRVLEAAAILDRALEDDLDSIIEMAEERRRRYLNKMREAIEGGDDRALKFYASKLCGLPTV